MAVSGSVEGAELRSAFELGWRVAYLYALVDDDLGKPLADTLLPLHQSLHPSDQLELQVRTAAGDARRANIPDSAASLDALVPQARTARDSGHESANFRKALWECHVEIDKDLWATCESDAKAYELGNGLSDTYNRICRAYRDQSINRTQEWRAVFAEDRVQRLKECLHDLQSRLDPRAVTVVSEHLDAWQKRVSKEEFEPPPVSKVRLLLRRQTIIWRQLLAGDKQPEAFLDRKQRATLRTELARLVWKRYLPFLPLLMGLVALLIMGVAHFAAISHWYEHDPTATGAVTLLASVAGALGITLASVGFSVRTRMTEWTELLWNRAVAKRVTEVTLVVTDLLPEPKCHAVVFRARRAGQRTKGATRRATRRMRGERAPAPVDGIVPSSE
jgi:hypothetical protein